MQSRDAQFDLKHECSVFQNYSGELNYLVALHELYKYINKYYDQVCVKFCPECFIDILLRELLRSQKFT